jgi:hypothetical protein
VPDVRAFFTEWLPEKLRNNPGLAKEINAVYVFDIGGFGQWTVDLPNGGVIREGAHANPGCTVTMAQADFQSLIEKPSSAMMLFTMGKLKVTNIPLALSLQKLLA